MFEDSEHNQKDVPDMLSPLDKVPHEEGSMPSAPPRTASALESGLIKPVQLPGQQPQPSSAPTPLVGRTPLASADMGMELPEIKAPFMSRWKIFFAVFVVLAFVTGGIYMFYLKITADNRVVSPTQQTPPQEQPEETPAPTPKPTDDIQDDSDTIVPPPPTVLPEAPKDTDQDGLTDVEEAELGTDPLTPDSDKDGLTDKEEVLLWRTDPKNPDSDGDTFLDGEEVSHGYRPDGPGKLFE